LRKRLEKLQVDFVASNDLIVQIEKEQEETGRELELCKKERDDLAQECGNLRSALRNAESDLRADQEMIETFEHNQQLDRGDIRQLQKRIEELVAELATFKASALKSDPTHKRLDRKKVG
jgi:hypothetical protein